MTNMSVFAGKKILIIVENLPLPFDRRVWQEANTLKNNGAQVCIICPKMKNYTDSYEVINGIEIFRHPLPLEGSGALGYLVEYGVALFWEFFYTLKIFLTRGIDVIHGCNPPDLIFLVALPFKLFGVKYLFDHHDINPELYIAKYNKKGFFYQLMCFFEKLTFKVASYSIATNESYKAIAIERGGMPADRVQVVRSGPSLERLKVQAPEPKYKKGRKYLVGYVGVIGEQEGLDLLMDVARKIEDQRQDVQFAIVGFGTELEKIKAYASELGLNESVDFYGRVPDDKLIGVLNTCDVCVNPDKPTEMNNLSTMNKIMEYMALKKPIVQFDLKEGRFSAQDSSLYVKDGDTSEFAEKICALLDDATRRRQMGEFGYNRVLNELSWPHEEEKLISVYRKLLEL